MSKPRYLSTLGLAMRAGKVYYGETTVREAMHTAHVALILLSSDAGASLSRSFQSISQHRGCPLLVLKEDKYALGEALGKSAVSVAAVTGKGLAESIVKYASIEKRGTDIDDNTKN